MKKIHIVLLVCIAGAVAALSMFMKDLTTYDSVTSAREKEGKYVHLIAKLDPSKPVQYDPLVNPNYLQFTAVDTLGQTTAVVFHSPKPADFEKSERLVLKGSMVKDTFQCKEILMKCPSKYKDDVKVTANELQTKP